MYEVECKNFEAGGGDRLLYVGNSGHTLHKRMLEHKQALRSGRGSDALPKYQRSAHQAGVLNSAAKSLQGV